MKIRGIEESAQCTFARTMLSAVGILTQIHTFWLAMANMDSRNMM